MSDTTLDVRSKSLAGGWSVHMARAAQALVLDTLRDMNQGHLRLTLPDGETLTYGQPEAELQAALRILRPEFFIKCLLYGDIGFGEAYVDGDWDTPDVSAVIAWMILNVQANPAMSGSRRGSSAINWLQAINRLRHRLRSNTLSGSRRNIAAHYDLSNDFFRLFLDPTLTYSSAYFARPEMTLEEAQRAKYDRLCESVRLRPGEHLLEIGTGWGGLALHAAERYGVRVTTVTVSRAQRDLAVQRVREAGLSDRIEVRLEDYRRVRGRFDKVMSIEMLEAVGHEHLKTYFAKCHEWLRPHGLLGLQVITCPDHRYDSLRRGVDWIQKHIFPGSLLPSIGAIERAVHATGELMLHRLEDMGPHYSRTLAAWREQLNARRPDVFALGLDEAFLRKWNYYFSYCEAAFRMRNISVVQMVYTRPNNLVLG